MSVREVGFDNFRLHDLRHTFAARLAQAGVDIFKISKLLGHKDIKMTQRYAHHCPDSLRDGVEAEKIAEALKEQDAKTKYLNVKLTEARARLLSERKQLQEEV